MTYERPTRRVVLRGALAVGCGLFLPLVSLGQANAASDDPPKKMSQATVHYQAQPKGDQKCSGCANFIAGTKSCKLVDGQIAPEGWCNVWAKKA